MASSVTVFFSTCEDLFHWVGAAFAFTDVVLRSYDTHTIVDDDGILNLFASQTQSKTDKNGG